MQTMTARRIVDRAVEPAERGHCILDQLAHLLVNAGIASEETRIAARRADGLHGFGTSLRVDVGDGHAGAILRKKAGGGSAHANAHAGDYSNLAIQPVARLSLHKLFSRRPDFAWLPLPYHVFVDPALEAQQFGM